MAATSRNPTFSTFITIKPHHSSILVLSFLPKSPPTPRRRSLSLQISSSTSPKPPSATPIHAPQHFISRFAPGEQRKGSDVLVEALEREGVGHVFAFPGGTILDIHQPLSNSNTIRNVLPRHEHGGTDAFSETPIVEITRSITKHNYVVLDVDDIPRIVEEAFFLANSGRPGPVLIDIPKDIQQQLLVPDWGKEMELVGYVSTLPKLPNHEHLGMVVQWEDRFYKSNRDMLKFAEACDIPSSRVTKVADLRNAIQTMLDTSGPYLLDVIVPHQEQVLPMIPSGGSFKDTINK